MLEGTVVSVIDGDTIRVRLGARTESVRYIGINTPELSHPTRGREPGAREAADANAALVRGEPVRLELDVQERDRYARLLASGRTPAPRQSAATSYAVHAHQASRAGT